MNIHPDVSAQSLIFIAINITPRFLILKDSSKVSSTKVMDEENLG